MEKLTIAIADDNERMVRLLGDICLLYTSRCV